jgi:Tol biopolymer transport system component
VGDVNSPYEDWHPCIAPDESYIIFDSNRPGSHLGEGTFDLYVCFRLQDGTWGKAINIGEKLNVNAENTIASITRDGSYLFYNSKNNGTWDIYWVSTKVIEDLRPKE